MRAAWGEITVMYGDTIVAVEHVRGEPHRRARASLLLGLGAALLLAGTVGLLVDVHRDRSAHIAARQHAQVQGEPRPGDPGGGLAGLGAALALLGVVPLVLGAVRLGDPQRRGFTIGEANDASFQICAPGLPGPRFPLLSAEAGPVLRFTAATRGELWTTTGQTTLAASDDAVHSVQLVPGARARVEHGPVSFMISAVEPETAKISRGRLDGPTWFYCGSAALILGGLLALGHLLPRVDAIVEFDDEFGGHHTPAYLHKQAVAPRSHGDGSTSLGPAKVTTTATTSEPARRARPGRRGATSPVPSLGRDHDYVHEARGAGVLAILAGEPGLLTGATGSYAAGDGDADVWGGATGTELGAANDVGGLGLAGFGPGIALHGEGVVDPRIELIGKGGGANPNGTSTGFIARGDRKPTVLQARAEVTGALDQDIIRRVVRAHLQELTHCYNQTLARDPQARGRVVVQFVISGTGSVATSVIGESDIEDKELGACTARAVRRWRFPRPEGGGNVLVSYPFVFAPA